MLCCSEGIVKYSRGEDRDKIEFVSAAIDFVRGDTERFPGGSDGNSWHLTK